MGDVVELDEPPAALEVLALDGRRIARLRVSPGAPPAMHGAPIEQQHVQVDGAD